MLSAAVAVSANVETNVALVDMLSVAVAVSWNEASSVASAEMLSAAVAVSVIDPGSVRREEMLSAAVAVSAVEERNVVRLEIESDAVADSVTDEVYEVLLKLAKGTTAKGFDPNTDAPLQSNSRQLLFRKPTLLGSAIGIGPLDQIPDDAILVHAQGLHRTLRDNGVQFNGVTTLECGSHTSLLKQRRG